jgi:hypothetical protein
MSRFNALFPMLLLGAALVAGDASAQCAGLASAATTETLRQIEDCDLFNPNLKGALQWTLSISCLDGCGQVWTTLPSRNGSADAACSVVPFNICLPQWYRYNYTNGLYAESSAWNMKVFNGCQADFQTITSGNCPCAPSCNNDPGGPVINPCSVTPPTEATVLELTEATSSRAPTLSTDFFSDRREVVDGIKYVMEDWAVLRLAGERAGSTRLISIEGSSSDRLASKRVPPGARGKATGSEESERIVLMVEAPAHPDNSRMIPPPKIELRPAAVPYLGPRITAAVRIDVDEAREIRDSRVLYSSDSLPTGIDLAEHLRTHLLFRYASEKRHRIIVYGIVDLEAGRVRLRENVVIVPLCCCNPVCV